jgi:hypothetical protein
VIVAEDGIKRHIDVVAIRRCHEMIAHLVVDRQKSGVGIAHVVVKDETQRPDYRVAVPEASKKLKN